MPLVAEFVRQLSVALKNAVAAKRFLCFPSGSEGPMDINIPPRDGGNGALDLLLANFFPNGCFSHRIARAPGTNILLDTAWRIYFSNGKYFAPVNQSILAHFRILWRGNILIVKHRRGSDALVQVTHEDEEYAKVLLGMWLQEFIRVRSRIAT
ncbi:hypothetical protein B0H16DRAFT_1447302 [Mycena metata]|uniref:Uncharacterized protein n=1 Tax=Mycena metata TaxID=1033252 RepID=A0AAD7P0Y9_9AGAR|nr:hypothetical protein B0H16DRAFT_1447302 [Mycena metata]